MKITYTKEYSIKFWRELLVRMEREIARLESELVSLTDGIPATIDSLPFVLNEIELHKAQFMRMLGKFSNIVSLKTDIESVVADREAEAGVAGLARELSWVNQMVHAHKILFSELPHSSKSLRQLKHLSDLEVELRNKGHNEQLTQERLKLKSQVEVLFPVSVETAERQVRDLQGFLAKQSLVSSDLESLVTSTKFKLELGAAWSSEILQEFGLELVQVEDESEKSNAPKNASVQESSQDSEPQPDPTADSFAGPEAA